MSKNNEQLIIALLSESLENIEMSAGRIILDSDTDTNKAGINDIKDARKAAKKFIENKLGEIRYLICDQYKDQISKINTLTDNGIELVGYIAAILESNNISVGPLNYIFISVWIVKNGLDKVCHQKDQ